MWICQRCYTENRESSTACEGCGAPRAAGRFNSAPQQRASRPAQAPIMSYPNAQRETVPLQNPLPERGEYQTPPPDTRKQKKRRPPFAARFARWIGVLLAVLLPILAALFAWRQYDALSDAVLPLLLGDGAAEWIKIALYAALSILAVLVSMLPGLWTVLLSRDRRE